MANSTSKDGSVNFDTKIDTSGFEKGLKTVEKEYEKTADSVEKDSKKSSEKIEKSSDDTSKSVRSQVAAIAAEYKKSGMNSSDAMKKAWADIKSNSKSSSESVKKHISGVGETSEQIFKDSEDAAKSAFDGTEIKSNTTLSEIKNKFGEVRESISETISSVGDLSDKFGSSMNLSVTSVAGLVGAIGGISAAVWSVGTDTEQAMNQVAASTGLTGDALAEIQDVTNGVYKDNFGESMEDVANSTAETYKQTKLTGEELKTATENALSLRDVFGYEVQESVRTAKALMDNFGISADDAYNLMLQGAQNGLDKNGDMLDTLNEYAVHYSQLGYSAEEFFGSLENGAASGAFSIDKIGDTMKEFGVRIKDTSESTKEAFQLLGYTAEEDAEAQAERTQAIEETSDKIAELEKKLQYAKMEQESFNDKTSELTRLKNADTIAAYTQELDEAKSTLESLQQPVDNTGKSMSDIQAKFAAGGESAKEATQEVLQQLSLVEDDVTRNQIGVDLFGTMWEDLGEDAVYSLLNTQTEISTTKDAMGQLNDVKYDDVKTAIEGLKRTAETDILQPFAQKIMPKLQDGIEWTAEHLDDIVDHAKPIAKAIATAFAIKKVTEFGTSATNTIKSVSKLVKLIPSVTNPYVMAAAAVAGVGAAIYADFKYANDYAVDLDSYTQHLIDKQDILNEKLDEQNEIHDEWEQGRADSNETVETEYNYYQNLANALDNIVDKNGVIKEGYENRAKAITGELSEALGIEIEIVDGQIQKYDDLKNKINEVMITKKANALLAANEDSYMEAQTNLAAESSKYSDALDNKKVVERRLQKAQSAKSAFEDLNSYGAGTDAYYAAVDRFVSQYGGDLGIDQSDIANNSTKVYQQIEKMINDTNTELEAANQKIEEGLNSVISSQSIIKNYEDMQVAIASGNVDEIEACNTRLLNNLKTAETGTRETLKKQMDDAHENWKDLQQKYDEGAAGISKSMVDTAYDTYVAANQEFNEFNQLASEAGYTAGANWDAGCGNGISENEYTITDALGNISKMLSQQAAELYQWGMDNGYQYAAGLAAGINDPGNTLAEEEASKAMYNMDRSAKDALDIHSPSKVAMKNGEYYTEGLAIGIQQSAGNAEISAERMAQDVINASQLPVSPWNTITNPPPASTEQAYMTAAQQPAATAQDGGNWILPVYLTPNTQVLDTIVISAKDRANAVRGGTEF